MPFASSFPLMIPHALYLGCYFLSVFTCRSQLILVVCYCKRNTLHFLFHFFLVDGNSLCQVKRTFWTLILYFFLQSFIMTIIYCSTLCDKMNQSIPIEYTCCLLKASKNHLTHIRDTLKKPNTKEIFNLLKLVITVYSNFHVIESFSNSVIIVTLQIF